jgi:predicted transcriptional regulator
MARNDNELVRLSSEIATAYVTHNALSAGDLPAMLQNIFAALSALKEPEVPVEQKLAPAVAIRKSVLPSAILCLECGLAYKSIKRHLMTSHGLTPVNYRERWHLQPDYPMVAPDYSATRSAMAKSIGLGQKAAARANTDRTSGKAPPLPKRPRRKPLTEPPRKGR